VVFVLSSESIPLLPILWPKAYFGFHEPISITVVMTHITQDHVSFNLHVDFFTIVPVVLSGVASSGAPWNVSFSQIVKSENVNVVRYSCFSIDNSIICRRINDAKTLMMMYTDVIINGDNPKRFEGRMLFSQWGCQ
jgi:hypothetical protein